TAPDAAVTAPDAAVTAPDAAATAPDAAEFLDNTIHDGECIQIGKIEEEPVDDIQHHLTDIRALIMQGICPEPEPEPEPPSDVGVGNEGDVISESIVEDVVIEMDDYRDYTIDHEIISHDEIKREDIDETLLVTFHSFKELENYKESIVRFIIKYLDKKWEDLFENSILEDDVIVIEEPGDPVILEQIPVDISLVDETFSNACDEKNLGGSLSGVNDGCFADGSGESTSVSAPVPGVVGDHGGSDDHSLININPALHYYERVVNPEVHHLFTITTTPAPHPALEMTVNSRGRASTTGALGRRGLQENLDLMHKYITVVHANRGSKQFNKFNKFNKSNKFTKSNHINSLHEGESPLINLYRFNSFFSYSGDFEAMTATLSLDSRVNGEGHNAPVAGIDSSQVRGNYEIKRGKDVKQDPKVIEKIIAEIKSLENFADLESNDDVQEKLKKELNKYKEMAKRLYENADYKTAIKLYAEILEINPEDFEALFNTGFCFREMEIFPLAASAFKKILELYYDNAYAWYCLSVIYAQTSEGAKELYCLQKARDFGYPVDFQRLSRLAMTYIGKNPF
ncbi:MAG: tetratricopeptide repeat protein, partial [Promethearchaeota archaeon]